MQPTQYFIMNTWDRAVSKFCINIQKDHALPHCEDRGTNARIFLTNNSDPAVFLVSKEPAAAQGPWYNHLIINFKTDYSVPVPM